jgi:hypothetical protein
MDNISTEICRIVQLVTPWDITAESLTSRRTLKNHKAGLSGTLLTFWELEKILKHEMERRPQLNEMLARHEKSIDD